MIRRSPRRVRARLQTTPPFAPESLEAGRPPMKRVGHSPGSSTRRAIAAAPGFAGPERLVGLGFRLLAATDIAPATSRAGRRPGAPTRAPWVLQPPRARSATCPAGYAPSITIPSATSETSAIDCARFCRDECVAISMIAACQHHACPAMRACAFALLGCSMIDEVVDVAESFAETMRGRRSGAVGQPRPWLAAAGGMPAATALRQ